MMGKIRELIMRIKCGKIAFVMAYKNPRIMQQGFIDMMAALFDFLIVAEESSTPKMTKLGIIDPNNEGHIVLNLWAAKPGTDPISRIDELITDRDNAISSAVHAERRRVWDVLSEESCSHFWTAQERDGFTITRAYLFPDGEPTAEESSVDQTNPPAGDRRGQ
jgi:hypothetical protein